MLQVTMLTYVTCYNVHNNSVIGKFGTFQVLQKAINVYNEYRKKCFYHVLLSQFHCKGYLHFRRIHVYCSFHQYTRMSSVLEVSHKGFADVICPNHLSGACINSLTHHDQWVIVFHFTQDI